MEIEVHRKTMEASTKSTAAPNGRAEITVNAY